MPPQCKYNRLPIHLFVSACAAPSMWDAALPAYGKGVRYSPWIFALMVNRQRDGTATDGGSSVTELRQQALLEQLQGSNKLPRHLRQPDKARIPFLALSRQPKSSADCGIGSLSSLITPLPTPLEYSLGFTGRCQDPDA